MPVRTPAVAEAIDLYTQIYLHWYRAKCWVISEETTHT